MNDEYGSLRIILSQDYLQNGIIELLAITSLYSQCLYYTIDILSVWGYDSPLLTNPVYVRYLVL